MNVAVPAPRRFGAEHAVPVAAVGAAVASIALLAWSAGSGSMLPIVALGGLAVVVAAFAEPVTLGLPLLVFIVFTNASDLLMRQQGTPSLLQPLIALLVAAALWQRRGREARALAAQPVTLLLAAWVVLLFAGTVWAREVSLADARVAEFTKGFALFAVTAIFAASRRGMRGAAAAFVAGAVAMASLSLVQLATGNFDRDFGGFATVQTGNIYGEVSHQRISGPVNDPNFYAQILLLAAPLAFALSLGARRRAPRIAFGAAALLLVGVAGLTYSRGAMLALALMAVVAAALFRLSLRKLALSLVLAVAIAAALPSDLRDRFFTLQEILPGAAATAPDSSVEKRKLMVGTAWKMFEDNPWVGVGAGNFTARFEEYSAQAGSNAILYDDPGDPAFPHSLYLEIAAEQGIAGLALFGAVVTAALVSLARSRREALDGDDPTRFLFATALIVALAGFLVTSLFLHGAFLRYLWLCLAFAAGLRASRSAEAVAA